jgi:hypothetical protein
VPAVVTMAVMPSGSTGMARPTRMVRSTRPARTTGASRVTGVTGSTRTTRPARSTGPVRTTRSSRITRCAGTTGASWSTGSRSKSSVAATTKAPAVATATKATPAVATAAATESAAAKATTTTAAPAAASQWGWDRVIKRGRSALAAGAGERTRNGTCRSWCRSHGDCRECSGDSGSGHQLVRSHHSDFCLLRAIGPRIGQNRRYIGGL